MHVIEPDRLPWLSEQQMIEVDRIMIEDLHIELIQMMENAGRNLARLAIERYRPSRVLVLAGSGGNGGGGLVAARHLHNHGVEVSVLLTSNRSRFAGVPGHQLDIVERMEVPMVDTIGSTDLVIDAAIGYSLRGAPRSQVGAILDEVNESPAPVLALDVPSGVDVTDGSTPGAAIRADATMTLAAPKAGLRGHDNVGALFVADISVPPEVYARVGAAPPPPFGDWVAEVRA